MDSLIGVTLPYYHITILQYHNMPSTFYYIKNVELEQYCNEYIWPRYFFSTPVWRILITIKMNFRYVGMSPRDMMSVLPTPDQWWVPFQCITSSTLHRVTTDRMHPLGIGVYWVDAPVHIIMPFTIYQNLVSLIERKYNFYTPVWGQFRHIAFKTGDSVNWNIKVNRILKVISATWKFRFSSWIH